jgi:hypothetical protein
MAIKDGTYNGRATGSVVLGKSPDKGTPFIEFLFVLSEGEAAGEEVRWTGYFSESKCGKGTVAERTIQSLQYCGWQGDDLSEFANGDLHGLDTNEVRLVIENEPWKSDPTKTTPRVQWVNKIGAGLNVQNALSKDDAASFGDKMKGLVLKMRTKTNAPATKDTAADFPHGANGPQLAANQRKGW